MTHQSGIPGGRPSISAMDGGAPPEQQYRVQAPPSSSESYSSSESSAPGSRGFFSGHAQSSFSFLSTNQISVLCQPIRDEYLPGDTYLSSLIIQFPLLRVGQHAVDHGDLSELVPALRVPVRVILPRQTPVALLQLLPGGGGTHLQDVVVSSLNNHLLLLLVSASATASESLIINCCWNKITLLCLKQRHNQNGGLYTRVAVRECCNYLVLQTVLVYWCIVYCLHRPDHLTPVQCLTWVIHP